MTSKNVYIISVIIFFLGFVAGWVAFAAMTAISPGATVTTPEPFYGGGTGTTAGGTVSGGSGTIEPTPGNGGGVACSMEAKLCPDGSAVGRSGPNCEFSPCPPIGGGQGSACQTDTDCSSGYECIDPSPVVREGAEANLRCWKIGSPHPICLSGDTRIETPNGDVAVKDIKEGMKVWTVNQTGQKISAIVTLTGKTFATVGHKVAHIQLSDGRDLYVSPSHTIADGRTAGELHAGDRLSGADVLSANLVPYTEEFTYDILPSGETGMYFANGILLQSTLAKSDFSL